MRRCCCLNCVSGCSSSRAKPELGAPVATEAKARNKINTRVAMTAAEESTGTKTQGKPESELPRKAPSKRVHIGRTRTHAPERATFRSKRDQTRTHALGHDHHDRCARHARRHSRKNTRLNRNEHRSSLASPQIPSTRRSALRRCPRFHLPFLHKPTNPDVVKRRLSHQRSQLLLACATLARTSA